MTSRSSAGSRKGVGGRRGGDADTRADILRSARRQFARGYSDASIRGIARDAEVDPSLVIQFFGGKDGLFLAAMADAMRPDEEIPRIARGNPATFGQRLAVWFFGLWEDDHRRYPIQAMLLSAATHPDAAILLRTYVTKEMAPAVAAVSRRRDAILRAELAGSHLIGTALVRYIYQVPPLCDVPLRSLTRLVGGAINDYLEPQSLSDDRT